MFVRVDTGTEPIVAGFDRHGNWHIPGGEGGGQFAKPGWSSAKALALRAVRGLFAANAVRDGDPDGTWLEAADDYLSRLGVAKGQAVRVRWGDDLHGLIDAVHPDGKTRPVKVKWERFADRLPEAPTVPDIEPPPADRPVKLTSKIDTLTPDFTDEQSEAFARLLARLTGMSQSGSSNWGGSVTTASVVTPRAYGRGPSTSPWFIFERWGAPCASTESSSPRCSPPRPIQRPRP